MGKGTLPCTLAAKGFSSERPFFIFSGSPELAQAAKEPQSRVTPELCANINPCFARGAEAMKKKSLGKTSDNSE